MTVKCGVISPSYLQPPADEGRLVASCCDLDLGVFVLCMHVNKFALEASQRGTFSTML